MYLGTYARSVPRKPAVILAETGETVTYEELDTRSLRFAWFLRDLGLRKGDHIAMLVGNEPRAYEIYWAAFENLDLRGWPSPGTRVKATLRWTYLAT